MEAQVKDPASLLNHVKTLLSLRKEYPALGNDGIWEFIGNGNDPYPLIYCRFDSDSRFIIAVNPTSARKTVDLPQGEYATVNTVGKIRLKIRKSSTRLVLEGCSSVILSTSH